MTNGKLRDNVSAGVLEPMLIKLKSISFATEAAISILRIDDMIKITPCAPPYPSALLRRPSAAFADPRRQRWQSVTHATCARRPDQQQGGGGGMPPGMGGGMPPGMGM